MGWIWWAAAVLSFAVSLRVILICTSSRPSIKKRKAGETCRVAVFLGSGGHTSEMMQLLKALPPHRYNARTYILTTSDRFSMDKALEYEKSIASSIDSATDATAAANPSSFDFIQLPRARSVHQKWLSTPISVLIAFAVSVHQLVLLPTVLAPRKVLLPDAIIMNGPGTCVPIVAAVYILRFFGLQSPRLIYVESFARVVSLSLTAKILCRFVDVFLVQWERGITSGADYRGVLQSGTLTGICTLVANPLKLRGKGCLVSSICIK